MIMIIIAVINIYYWSQNHTNLNKKAELIH